MKLSNFSLRVVRAFQDLDSEAVLSEKGVEVNQQTVAAFDNAASYSMRPGFLFNNRYVDFQVNWASFYCSIARACNRELNSDAISAILLFDVPKFEINEDSVSDPYGFEAFRGAVTKGDISFYEQFPAVIDIAQAEILHALSEFRSSRSRFVDKTGLNKDDIFQALVGLRWRGEQAGLQLVDFIDGDYESFFSHFDP